MFQPLSGPLQPGVRFLRPPIPALPTAFLTVRLPALTRWQQYGLTTFPACHTTDLGSASPPAVQRRRNPSFERVIRPHTFWFMPDSSLGTSTTYEVYQQFTYVNHVGQPSSLTPSLLGVSTHVSRDSCVPETSGGYIVRRASHPTVTSDACLPRLLLVVQQVPFTHPCCW